MQTVKSLVSVLLALFFLAGCRSPSREGASRFARPADGTVRVLFTRLSPEHVKWSLIGERNWVQAQAQGSSLFLREVYPLNAVNQRGGCFTWEIDLILEKERWKARVHGSNGKTAETGGAKSGELSLRIDQDTDLRLPTDTVLATIGETPLRLSVER
jgi:hypothetical protein